MDSQHTRDDITLGVSDIYVIFHTFPWNPRNSLFRDKSKLCFVAKQHSSGCKVSNPCELSSFASAFLQFCVTFSVFPLQGHKVEDRILPQNFNTVSLHRLEKILTATRDIYRVSGSETTTTPDVEHAGYFNTVGSHIRGSS